MAGCWSLDDVSWQGGGCQILFSPLLQSRLGSISPSGSSLHNGNFQEPLQHLFGRSALSDERQAASARQEPARVPRRHWPTLVAGAGRRPAGATTARAAAGPQWRRELSSSPPGRARTQRNRRRQAPRRGLRETEGCVDLTALGPCWADSPQDDSLGYESRSSRFAPGFAAHP